MPQTIDATRARETFSDLINRVVYAGEEFVVKRQGKPVARITSVGKSVVQGRKSANFLAKLCKYKLKGVPADLAKNHDKYTWR